MEINFHLGNLGATSHAATVARATERDASSVRDDVALENSRALTQALQLTPATRADVVRRATELVGEPNYPPPETIRKISHLLAIQMHPEG
jgi:hypothetical protein